MQRLEPHLRVADKGLISIPRSLLAELSQTAERLSAVLETLEIESDAKLMGAITQSKKEFAQGKFAVAKNMKDVKKLLG